MMNVLRPNKHFSHIETFSCPEPVLKYSWSKTQHSASDELSNSYIMVVRLYVEIIHEL